MFIWYNNGKRQVFNIDVIIDKIIVLIFKEEKGIHE